MSILKISTLTALSSTRRIDAEYFLPERIEAQDKVQKFPRLKTLDQLAIWVTQGPNPRFSTDGVICLNGKNIYFGSASTGEPNHVTHEEFSIWEKFKLLPNDIVITLKHATKIGRAWIIADDEPKMFSRNLGVIRLSPNSQTNPASMLFYLWSKHAQLILDRFATGGTTGQITLAISALKKLPVPIFQDKFQIILGKLLDEFLCLVKISKQQNLLAEQLLLLESSLLDYKPNKQLCFLGSYFQTLQRNRIDAEHFIPRYKELRERISNYPNGYYKITDMAEVSDEMTNPRAHPEGDYNYIELANIGQLIGTIESSNLIKGKDAPSRARMLLRNEDVIVSTIEGSLKKVALVSKEYDGSIGSTGFFVLRAKTVTSTYLLALVKSFIVREQMHCEASGTILSAVSAKSLRNIIIPNIPPDKQEDISRLVQQSHFAWHKSKVLLARAKRAVEMAIEEGEEKAIKFLECG